MLKALAACSVPIVACHPHAAGVAGSVRKQQLDAIRPAAATDMCEGDPPYEEPGSYDGLDLPCGIYRGVPSICTDKPIDLCLAHHGLAPRRRR